MANLLDEKCPQCGVPIWYAFSTNSDIGFKMKTITCYGCQHKETEGPEAKDRKPGETQVVYAVPADDVDELPPRRDFFERQAKAHQLEHQRELERKAKEYQ